jgi:hypothetical protein
MGPDQRVLVLGLFSTKRHALGHRSLSMASQVELNPSTNRRSKQNE